MIMSTVTGINYIDKNVLWIREQFVESLSNYVCQVFESQGLDGKPEWYIEIYEEFDVVRKGLRPGYVGFVWEDDLQNDSSREAEIIAILEEAKTMIAAKGKEISTHELNELEQNREIVEYRQNWPLPVQTKDYIQVLDIFIKMLKHEWMESYDMTFEGYDRIEPTTT
jgi:hypothetical protein